MADFDWSSLISPALSYFGASGASEGTAKAQKEAAEEEQRRYEARRRAYEEMVNRSKGDFGAGEEAFTKEATTALPELQTMENQIRSGGSESLQDTARQMKLNIAQQGLRGGQAATQLRRGLGEVGKGTLADINKLKYEEAAGRAGERRKYQAEKARAGQTASYTPPNF